MNKSKMIILTGPTATGKSDIAIKFGELMKLQGQGIEIINADIGSLYSKLSIGTAKPDWKKSIIPHHFFDIIDDTGSWTAPQFRQAIMALLPQILQRGNIPVVVGGSAFYIQSLFYQHHTMQPIDKNILKEFEIESPDNLWQQLKSIDPKRAAAIDPADHYRLVRALGVWKSCNTQPSQLAPIWSPIINSWSLIYLQRDRDQLYKMIDNRVDQMIESGWIHEVAGLIEDQDWRIWMQKKKIIGYDLLAEYLLGNHSDHSFEQIVAKIAQKTRNYAKRQTTFLDKLIQIIERNKLQNCTVQNYNLSHMQDCQIIESMIQLCLQD